MPLKVMKPSTKIVKKKVNRKPRSQDQSQTSEEKS